MNITQIRNEIAILEKECQNCNEFDACHKHVQMHYVVGMIDEDD